MAMTVIYANDHYRLEQDVVTVAPAGEQPHPIDASELPLPVARVLRTLQASPEQRPLLAAA
jgi:hypothetical protein